MPKNNEDGFVLISAMWLLLLGAALAALIMLHVITQNRDFAADDRRFDQERLQSDAIEIVTADLIFNGARSRWAALPANGSVDLDGTGIAIAASDEATRLDVNKADLRQIDGILQDRGYVPAQRIALLDRLATIRAVGRPIRSYSEVAALGRGIVDRGQEDCLLDALSPFRGDGHSSNQNGPLRPGSVIRLRFGTHVQTLRLVAANDRSYGLLDDYQLGCSSNAG